MQRNQFCAVINIASATELLWPYFLYCASVTNICLRALWRNGDGFGDFTQLKATLLSEATTLVRRTGWRVLCYVVLGGGVLLALASYVCVYFS